MGEAAGGSSVPPPPAEAGGGQVNALTVLALLEKLVSMLEAVEGQQRQMEQRQRGLEGAVRGIQGDLGKLCRSHGATGEAVEKLLEKSRKVCAHTRAVRERLERQCAQVRRLEQHHAQLLRRDRFKVLIFQEENEIPASVFAKEPVPSITEGKEEPVDENKTLEETLHTVELSSDDDMPHEDDVGDSAEEKTEESRAEKLKRSSLKKVDSLKKAFSRQNIEKKMNKIGTKIVSPERREKIKKSLTVHHQKSSSSKSSAFKVSPLAFNVKKGREGESPAEAEDRPAETASNEQAENEEEMSFADMHSDMTPTTSLTEESKAVVDSLEKEARVEGSAVMNNNIELSIVEDDEEYGVPLEVPSQKLYEERNKPVSGEMEESDEETTQAAVLQINQTA
ncbi:caveolae-associated protein 2 [Anas acuta]|uniref:Caveolae associated protein 2 n=1 Tax=Anas platyrhynchos TaxID=8839 RepID=A0A8B9THI4_ANAPL|nr:caveolae-associated protein 2 [Anas platyrhynchos]|eukprot:XP_027317694.1 caveolae-associated protein 2 [Anas platyrhynchos]